MEWNGNRNEPKQPSTSKIMNTSGKIMSTRFKLEAEPQENHLAIQAQENKRDWLRNKADSFCIH